MRNILLAALISSYFFSVSMLAEQQNKNVELDTFHLADALIDPLSYPATYQADSSNSYHSDNSIICTVPDLKKGETFDCGGTIFQGSGKSSSGSMTIETTILTNNEIELIKHNEKLK